MAKVFLSFLGLGNYDLILFEGTKEKTRFIQSAILQIHGKNFFDRIRIITTEKSREKYWEEVKNEITNFSNPKKIQEVLINDDLQKEQWNWFLTIFNLVDEGDDVWFDMTHGYRAFSIILSAAIGFIQRTKNINLQAVYYGANEAPGCPIVNMKDFYIINDWAEAVGRLIDDADARKLGELAIDSQVNELKALGDEALIKSFNDMTDCIRNVDVNNVSVKVANALNLVLEHQKKNTGAAKLLLELVWRKFSGLAAEYPQSGRYDAPYFETQLKIINTLIEHKLFMQAFTSMREFVGSIGMINLPPKYNVKMHSSVARKKYRRRFAEVFINMMQYPEEKWDFQKYGDMKRTAAEILEEWYKTLQKYGIEQNLRDICGELINIRNGFDHAWTSEVCKYDEIEEKGKEYSQKLKETLDLLIDNNLIPQKMEGE